VRQFGSRLLAVLAGLSLGAVFLALAFRGTALRAVAQALAGADWGLPALETLLATAAFTVAKTARWRILLGAPADLSVGYLLRPVLAGLALNALVPHSGEFVRAFGLKRGAGRAPSAVLSSIVAERVFDLFGVLLLGGFALAAVDVSGAVAAALRLVAVIAGVMAAAIVVALRFPAVPGRCADALARQLPAGAGAWLSRQVASALAGFEPVRSPRTSARVLAWSVLQWLAVAVMVHGCGAVVGVALGAAACCLVVVGIVVAFLLPNAPGYAGSVQVAFLVVLQPLGTPEPAALAASIVYQLLVILPLILAGIGCLRATLRAR
jgi:glycosyltransferase 2 family protein